MKMCRQPYSFPHLCALLARQAMRAYTSPTSTAGTFACETNSSIQLPPVSQPWDCSPWTLFKLLAYQPLTLAYFSDYLFSYIAINKGIAPLFHENNILSLHNAPFCTETHHTPKRLGRLAIFSYPVKVIVLVVYEPVMKLHCDLGCIGHHFRLFGAVALLQESRI